MSSLTSSPDRGSCPSCTAVFRGGFTRCPRDGTALMGGDADPLIGSILAERYIIEALLGEGGLGRVYQARHVRMSRRFAIKVPFGELAGDPTIRARFIQEAEAISRLDHTNVIGVVDVGETASGLLYMVMDLAEGPTLADVIDGEGALAPARILDVFEQLVAGLAHAHDRGLVHRDLKPDNVILELADGEPCRVRIVDFGISVVRDGDDERVRLTTAGTMVGTPHYMAPEQAHGAAVDQRTDLFALGVMLYEMLAGSLPFDGTPMEVIGHNLCSPPPRITQRIPGLAVDPHLQALAFQLMEKRPEDRPARAADVLELLGLIRTDPDLASRRLRLGGIVEVEADVEDEPAVAPPPVAVPARPCPQRRRRRTAVLPLAGFAIAALAMALVVRPAVPLARSATPADRSPPPLPLLVLASPDPAPSVREVVVDAAPVIRPAPVVGERRHPRASRPARVVAARVEEPDLPRAVAPPPAPAPPPAAVPAVAPQAETLRALYIQIGAELNRRIEANGTDSVRDLSRRYRAVPYLDSVHKPDLRAQVMRELRAMAAELRLSP